MASELLQGPMSPSPSLPFLKVLLILFLQFIVYRCMKPPQGYLQVKNLKNFFFLLHEVRLNKEMNFFLKVLMC